MRPTHIVARYHEIALKGNNRPRFVKELANNITRMLRGTGVLGATHGPGRLIFGLKPDCDWNEIRSRLTRVFGVANFLACHRTERSLEALRAEILPAIEGMTFRSFALRTRRADKTFPVQSPEVSRLLGDIVRTRTGATVDLTSPDLEIHVDITDREAFLSTEKVEGPRGLPLGSSGRVVCLLSGGIDSPVAAHRMMQRGCEIEFVHFHGAPYQSRASQDKAVELLEVLNTWQPDARLHLIPFGEIQREIVSGTPRRFRVMLYRRMMVRIAETIASREHATALVTGESLGQVSSQTLPNLAVTEDAATMPVLRPLIGMDKLEIAAHAERIGTYPISIQPDEDCCQLFVPRHPATAMTVAEAHEAERGIDIPELMEAALTKDEVLTFAFPHGAPKRSSVPLARCEHQ